MWWILWPESFHFFSVVFHTSEHKLFSFICDWWHGTQKKTKPYPSMQWSLLFISLRFVYIDLTWSFSQSTNSQSFIKVYRLFAMLLTRCRFYGFCCCFLLSIFFFLFLRQDISRYRFTAKIHYNLNYLICCRKCSAFERYVCDRKIAQLVLLLIQSKDAKAFMFFCFSVFLVFLCVEDIT